MPDTIEVYTARREREHAADDLRHGVGEGPGGRRAAQVIIVKP
jgi:hypothetical protein